MRKGFVLCCNEREEEVCLVRYSSRERLEVQGETWWGPLIPTGTQTMRTSNCLHDDSVLCVFVKYDLCVGGCMGLGGTYAHEERQSEPHGKDRSLYRSCCNLPFSLVLA